MKINFPLRTSKAQKDQNPGGIPGISVFWSPLPAGKSLLARTFAYTLSREYPGSRICLLDYDIFTPSQPYKGLDLNQAARMVFRGDFDAGRVINNLSPLKQNIYCLGGLTELLSMDLISRDVAASLIDSAEENYDFVIIDAGREVNHAPTLTALDKAGLVMVPVDNKEGGIRHTRRFLDFLRDDLFIDNIKVLKNLVGQELTEKEIERLLEYPVLCTCEQVTGESTTLDNLLSALLNGQEKKAN